MKVEEPVARFRRFFGTNEWPKPLNCLLALERVSAGQGVAEAAKFARTTKSRLTALLSSSDPVRDLIGISIKEISDEQILKTRLILGQLFLGECAEEAFERIYKDEIGTSEIKLVDLRESRSDTDYRLVNGRGRFLYRVNIKFHGSRFRRSKELVGLEPGDSFPLATYKIYGALQKQEVEHLPYIFTIVGIPHISAEEVGKTYSASMVETVAWLKAGKVTRKRSIEEIAVQTLKKSSAKEFNKMIEELRSVDWSILSARKADLLLREKLFDRVYALRIRGFAQAFRGAELDMHYSVSSDMTPLRDFLHVLRTEGETKVASLLERGTF